MNLLINLGILIGKYMSVIVLTVAVFALFIPKTGLWISLSWINYLLMIIMFGMGLTLKFEDFKFIFSRPKEVAIGCIAQFTIMPIIAFILCTIFNLNPALTVGVVLVGTCPGGTSSNVITYLSKGDVAFSVSMTSINTILALFITPVATYILLNKTIHVDIISMFISIFTIVIVPITLGFIINKTFISITKKIINFLPIISVAGICMIVSSVVSHNANKILSTGLIIFVVVILHNILGYIFGFILGNILKFNKSKTKALSIEIGMQNSGLATSLANTYFSSMAMATVPGAIFSVWHNISGAILANIYNHQNIKK